MRQVKFRGLLQSGVFIYGSYVTDGKDYHAILRENPDDSLEMLNTPVIPDSVGQLTGLQDKDGVDIYEGDIVLCYPDEIDVRYTRIVESDNDRPDIGITTNGRSGLILCKKATHLIEIIGNIHENPELLEQVK
jgi:uncharacterized phage protein (TIGR01671 family)